MPHRRLVLALAFTVGCSVLALVAFITPRSFGAPIATSAVESPPPMLHSGPSAEFERAREYRQIAAAVETDRLLRFYEWAAAQPPPAAPTPKKASPSSAPAVAPALRGTGSATAAIAHWFPDLYDSAYGVAHCESTLDPGAISAGGANWGLFQINTVHRDDFEAYTGHPWADVLDADLNAMYARKLYDGDGWGPWACSWAA